MSPAAQAFLQLLEEESSRINRAWQGIRPDAERSSRHS